MLVRGLESGDAAISDVCIIRVRPRGSLSPTASAFRCDDAKARGSPRPCTRPIRGIVKTVNETLLKSYHGRPGSIVGKRSYPDRVIFDSRVEIFDGTHAKAHDYSLGSVWLLRAPQGRGERHREKNPEIGNPEETVVTPRNPESSSARGQNHINRLANACCSLLHAGSAPAC